MIKHLLHLSILCLILSSCITEEETPNNAANLSVGDLIPSFNVTMNDGRIINDKSLKGKTSVIVFFHTGCKDCQKELPIIQLFHDTCPEIPLICISRGENEASISAYWKANQLTLPYSAQEGREVFELFASQTIPRIYIVDSKGIIQRIFTDDPLVPYEELMEAVMEIQ